MACLRLVVAGITPTPSNSFESIVMTVYVEVAQALVASGYLSGADVRAAVAILVDTMRITGGRLQNADMVWRWGYV